MLLQLFVVARVVNWAGVPVAMCILPVVALVSYTRAALLPTLAMVRWIKTAENSVDYSLMNTVRQMLFLPTSRKEKFKAKQVIDSFIVRVGDVLSAITVYVGTALLSLTVAQFAWINGRWFWLAGLSVITGLEFRRRVSAQRQVGMMRLVLTQWLLLLLASAVASAAEPAAATSMPLNTARGLSR